MQAAYAAPLWFGASTGPADTYRYVEAFRLAGMPIDAVERAREDHGVSFKPLVNPRLRRALSAIHAMSWPGAMSTRRHREAGKVDLPRGSLAD